MNRRGTEGEIMYHVAGDGYRDGDDLMSWETLLERGIVTGEDWHWDDADYCRADTSLVYLHATIEGAREYQAEFGGRIIAIDVWDMTLCDCGHGEPYQGITDKVPAWAIIGETK